MRFNKQRATWLDQENASALLTRVSLDTVQYNKTHKRHHTPEILIQLLDCDRRVQINEFGETRKEHLKKVRLMMHELLHLETAVVAAWDKYDKFWDGREENKTKVIGKRSGLFPLDDL